MEKDTGSGSKSACRSWDAGWMHGAAGSGIWSRNGRRVICCPRCGMDRFTEISGGDFCKGRWAGVTYVGKWKPGIWKWRWKFIQQWKSGREPGKWSIWFFGWNNTSSNILRTGSLAFWIFSARCFVYGTWRLPERGASYRDCWRKIQQYNRIPLENKSGRTGQTAENSGYLAGWISFSSRKTYSSYLSGYFACKWCYKRRRKWRWSLHCKKSGKWKNHFV